MFVSRVILVDFAIPTLGRMIFPCFASTCWSALRFSLVMLSVHCEHFNAASEVASASNSVVVVATAAADDDDDDFVLLVIGGSSTSG